MPKKPLKRLQKKEDLKVGMKVVVNNLVDTYIYNVDSITADGLGAHLSYVSGDTKYEAGVMYYSCLYYPSKEQLEYDAEHNKKP